MMLEREEAVRRQLIEWLGCPEDKCRVQRARRIWLEVAKEDFLKVVDFIANTLKFGMLCTITGLDAGEEIQMIYHFARDDGIVLNVKQSAPKSDPVFETVTGHYQGATLYEIETMNLLGTSVKGIPDDIRYPLPDGWPEGQHPLRKDWNREVPEIKGEGEC